MLGFVVLVGSLCSLLFVVIGCCCYSVLFVVACCCFGESGQSGTGNESVSRGPKVTDMKDALKKAGVVFPATAKKSDLQKLMEEHHIQV